MAKRTFFSCGTKAKIQSGQDGAILHARYVSQSPNQNTGFTSSCPHVDLAIY